MRQVEDTSGAAAPVYAMADLDTDPERVRSLIRGLDAAALGRYGLRGVHLNLLALLARRWSRERIRDAAFELMRNRLWGEWEFHAHLRRFNRDAGRTGEADAARRHDVWLRGWNREMLASLTAEGSGLILCSFHFGPFRFQPFDLALLGFRTMIPLDRAAFLDTAAAREETTDPQLQARFGLTLVERQSSALTLARALRRDDVVFVYMDGNTGLDGVSGDRMRTPIDFCELPIRVKSGIPRLAASLGAMLLPVVSVREPDGGGRIEFGAPIRPGGRLRGDRQEAFIRDATQALYGFLERHFREHPEQWESVAYLHRWRIPEDDGGARVSALPPEQLRRHIEAGGVLRIDGNRVFDIGSDTDPLLVDVRDLRGFKPPVWAHGLVRVLAAGAPLDRAGIDGVAADGDRVYGLLSQLTARGLVVAEPEGAGRVAAAEAAAGRARRK